MTQDIIRRNSNRKSVDNRNYRELSTLISRNCVLLLISTLLAEREYATLANAIVSVGFTPWEIECTSTMILNGRLGNGANANSVPPVTIVRVRLDK